ncbi:MAG: hypothetical protein ACXADB_09940 [Candidatus Hermodarchaeia archaeon]
MPVYLHARMYNLIWLHWPVLDYWPMAKTMLATPQNLNWRTVTTPYNWLLANSQDKQRKIDR